MLDILLQGQVLEVGFEFLKFLEQFTVTRPVFGHHFFRGARYKIRTVYFAPDLVDIFLCPRELFLQTLAFRFYIDGIPDVQAEFAHPGNTSQQLAGERL